MVSEPAALAVPGNLLEMHISRYDELETLGLDPVICVLTSLPGESDVC